MIETTLKSTQTMDIPNELIAKIDETVARYPVSKRSATLPLLHLFQEHFGFISPEAVEWIANRLELKPINVLELVTFYPMFREKPAGRFHIRVCRTLSCAMAGSYELKKELARLAGIEDETCSNGSHGESISRSPDGRFSIEFVECLASCGTGPVCMINDDFYEAVTPAKAAEIINSCQ